MRFKKMRAFLLVVFALQLIGAVPISYAEGVREFEVSWISDHIEDGSCYWDQFGVHTDCPFCLFLGNSPSPSAVLVPIQVALTGNASQSYPDFDLLTHVPHSTSRSRAPPIPA